MGVVASEPSRLACGTFADAVISRGGVDLIPDGVNVEFHGFTGGTIGTGGYFVVECYDPDGNLKWEDIAENGVTDVGIASLLNVYLRNQTQIATWYIGLIDNAGFSTLDPTDTMSSHAGWSEVAGANYSQSTRPTWSAGAPSGGAIVNASTVDFTMINGSPLTVKGLLLVSNNTKDGTSGVLFATAPFTGGTQAVTSGDTLKVTYTVSAASA